MMDPSIDLGFETCQTICRVQDGAEVSETYIAGYGPTRALAESLDETRRDELRREFVAFHDRFAAPLGISMPRQYLVTLATRR